MAVLDGQLKELDRLRKEQEQVFRKINGIHTKLQHTREESQTSLSIAPLSVCLKRSYFWGYRNRGGARVLCDSALEDFYFLFFWE